jgi:hypothetical protein
MQQDQDAANNEKAKRDQEQGLVNKGVAQPKKIDEKTRGSEPPQPGADRPAKRPL